MPVVSAPVARSIVLLLAFVAASGCKGRDIKAIAERAVADSVHTDSVARARQDSINRAQPGYVVDSIFPVEEELRRFRKAVGGDSAVAFLGGSPSREALVKRFLAALSASDTADMRSMAVRTREFADLYYPESPYAKPPYHQPPDLAWSLIQNPSADGIKRLLDRFSGKQLVYISHACDPKVQHDGRTTRYTGCLVTVIEPTGSEVTRRYFGSIVERDGQFKFLSYTNQF